MIKIKIGNIYQSFFNSFHNHLIYKCIDNYVFSLIYHSFTMIRIILFLCVSLQQKTKLNPIINIFLIV